MSTMDRDDFDRAEFDRLLDETSQMDDEALDAVVARAAADYNAPPQRLERPAAEAMWAHIAAAQRPAKHGLQGRLHVQRWQLLAASVAFLAFGITIGRQWNGLTSGGARAGAPATPAAHSTSPAASTPRSTPAAVPSPVIPHDVHHGAPDVAPSVRPTSHAAPRVDDGAPSSTRNDSPTAPASDAAYQLATMRHFAAAEALLASYDGSARDARTDAQLASWASDLLSQTRLLLDSPAGRDPVRRRLLQDLELVLVQMAQLGPNAPKVEHDLIDGSVRHNDIITRLRSAVPAGATTAL